MSPHTQPQESGIVISGLALLLSSFFVAMILFLWVYRDLKTYESAQEARRILLERAFQETQLLNRIAAHNALSVIYLSEALEQQTMTYTAGYAYQHTLPFWEPTPKPPTQNANSALSQIFQNTGRGYAKTLQMVFYLFEESKTAVNDLATRRPIWKSALSRGTPEEMLCQALEFLSLQKPKRKVKAFPWLIFQPIQFTNCETSLGGQVLFSPEKTFLRAQLKDSHSFGLFHLTDSRPLCQKVPLRAVQAPSSLLPHIFAQRHEVVIGPGQVELRHPRLNPACDHSRVQKKSQGKLFSPHWAPAYLTKSLGG